MKVLLLKDIPNLGRKGDTVDVSPGFFTNSLAPRKLAQVASHGLVTHIKNQKEKEGEKLEARKDSAKRVHEMLDGKTVTLKERSNQGGTLFAAIHEKEIAEQIKKEYRVTLSPNVIQIQESIKHLGDFEIKLKLYEGVSAKMTLHVTA